VACRSRLPRDRNGGVGVLELSEYPGRIVVGAMSHGQDLDMEAHA